jgi:hypothetical protein
MPSDLYVKSVLTVIAATLVYLCVVFTPLPAVSAQAGRVVGGRTPGEYTGPAEVVIVDWRLPQGASLPVNVTRGEVQVTNELSVRGDVELTQPPNKPLRALLIGFEEGSSPTQTGKFAPLAPAAGRALPVSVIAAPLRPAPRN